jgi:uncharacterized protein (TIGR02271 family)
MDRSSQTWQIPTGVDVIGADGDKVGKVIGVDASYIVVEKGWFFPSDYYIPVQAVSTFDGDKVYLTVSKDEALQQGWDQPLTSTDTDGYDTTGIDGEFNDNLLSGDRLATRETIAPDQTSNTTSTTDETGTLRVPVHEEELTATTRPVERGQVRIDKDVIAEEQMLEVPVTEERVTVTRRSVDRDAGVDEHAFEGETIEVPLRSEEVELQKRTRVAEEIEVGKEAVQRTERVAGTVRREEVSVEDQSDAEVTDGTTGTTAVPRR